MRSEISPASSGINRPRTYRRHNPNAAIRLVNILERRWDLLTLHPFSGAPREDIAPGIRHLVVGEYLTLYRVGADAVEILRVLHGRRSIEAHDLAS
ncbi:MAG: type II toxin-antitoxin system RelE/ParE family toxin [Mesorhizobium sp.]|nr:MAG: type II toxin-antitoxin system RelE/ParE family toxin [Mesorhizobium sp.]